MFRYSCFSDAWPGTCFDTVAGLGHVSIQLLVWDMLRYSCFSDAWSGTCLDTVAGLGHV